jgi:AFG3 family protein
MQRLLVVGVATRRCRLNPHSCIQLQRQQGPSFSTGTTRTQKQQQPHSSRPTLQTSRTTTTTTTTDWYVCPSLPRRNKLLLFSPTGSWDSRDHGGGYHPTRWLSVTSTILDATNSTLRNANRNHSGGGGGHYGKAANETETASIWDTIGKPRAGTGFDNFLPNDKKAGNNDSDEKTESGNGNGNGSDDQKDNDNDPNNNNTTNNWAALAMSLFIVYLLQQRIRSDNHSPNDDTHGLHQDHSSLEHQHHHHHHHQQPNSHHSHRNHSGAEISWHDFFQLLQQGAVYKIVVTDHEQDATATARVYLLHNHHPSERSARVFGNTNSNSNSNSAGSSSLERAATSTTESSSMDLIDDSQTSITTSSSNTNMTTLNSSSSLPPPPSNPQQHLVWYRMKVGSLDSFERKLDEAQRLLGFAPAMDIPVQYTSDASLTRELLNIVPGILVAVAMFALMRYAAGASMGGGGGGGSRGGGSGGSGAGGMFSIGKSTAKRIAKEDVTVDFSHVAGCDQAKKEIMEFVDFLKDSSRFTKLGAKIPKGALLCGPPGTGKTLLAKAVAGEAGVPFYSISGSDFIEMFVGVGPSRVRDLFAEARANAPCIVFIDEIDAVGRQRGRSGMGSNDERENTLNQLLVEMDGFSPTTGVVVLAGTNRVDILDQALTRPGRFDRQITVDKPDLQGRKDIFKVHLKGITLEGSIDDVAGRLAGLTPGFAGADIANMVNEAAIVAARRQGETVTMADFEKATDRIIGGLESNKIMSKEERSIVAHHEAGHAVAGWFLEHADALLKVTIIPRSSGALGFAQYLPKEVFLRTHDQIMDIVCMALAGRAAEEIFFGSVTTGASDDLKRVTALVYSTIQLYGMNPRLGQLSFPKDPNAMFEDRPYSEKTAKVMDEEARATVDAAYERTLNLLRSKKDQVQMVAQMLLEKETITHDDIASLIGERPFVGDTAYDEYIRKKRPVVGNESDESTESSAEADTMPPILSPA